MYKSKNAKAWMSEAGWEIKNQTKIRKQIEDEVIVYVSVWKKRTTDIDNFLKCSMDILEQTGIIKNDNQICELHVYRNKAKKGDKEYMEVQIETWED